MFLDWDPRYLYRKYFGDDTEAMERFLAEVCAPDWHARMDAGKPILESCTELAAQYPDQAELVMAWAQRAEEMITGVYEGTVEVLRELIDRGVRCFALSNMEVENYQRRLELYPFMRWFEGSFISGSEGVIKPDPRYFRRALVRLGLAVEDVVFIDDRPVNVEAASVMGLRTIWFRSPEQLRRRLAAMGLPLSAEAPGALS